MKLSNNLGLIESNDIPISQSMVEHYEGKDNICHTLSTLLL